MSTLLRRTLAVDAATCAGFGVLLFLFHEPLAGLLGLPAAVLYHAGLALFPCAALMMIARNRHSLSWVVVAGNAAWVVASVALLLLTSPTLLGYAFVIAQAVAVAVLAELEYVGLARAAS